MPGVEDNLRVLVVDDDDAMLETLGDVLGAYGYAVECAASGEEAIEKARRTQPDCILMDVRMPGLNGLDTYRRIKSLAPDSFAVLMTAYSAESIVEDARREGVVDVLPKPLDLETLVRLIEENSTRIPVLIVDDDPEFCRSLGDALSLYPFDVALAFSIEEAVASFAREPRRAVILDMKLNGENGLDAMRRLKEMNPGAVVVLVTGFADLQDEIRKGLAMSAAASFLKPFEIDELALTIRNEVDRRRSERRASA